MSDNWYFYWTKTQALKKADEWERWATTLEKGLEILPEYAKAQRICDVNHYRKLAIRMRKARGPYARHCIFNEELD
jgi:hypothetical protein